MSRQSSSSKKPSDPKGRILGGGGFVGQLRAKLARALCFAWGNSSSSSRRRRWRSSRRICSSSLARSRSYADPIMDTHRAEAVEDCIEFLNASSFSTFRRSTSSAL